MPLLSFGAGLPDTFKDKLLSGEKLQTVREIRKNPIKVGDTLFCWWKSRDPQRKQKLFDARCTDVVLIEICCSAREVFLDGRMLSNLEVQRLAIADGFQSPDDFYRYFSRYKGKFIGVLIKWERLGDNVSKNG